MKKIKVIQIFDLYGEFEKKVNDFCSKENVFATQTHVCKQGEQVLFVAILFYEEKSKQ